MAVIAAVIGFILVGWPRMPQRNATHSLFAANSQGMTFLFDGEALVDCTSAGRLFLSASRARGSAWLKLIGQLTIYFPDVEAQLQQLGETGQIILDGRSSKGKRMVMTAEEVGGLLRITLIDPTFEMKSFGTDPLAFSALTREIEMLRDTLGKSPVLIWRENDSGEVVWANTGYLDLAARLQQKGKELGWPLPRLFERVAAQQALPGQRATISLSATETLWFDMTSLPSLGERVAFAVPADTTVKAEQALGEFMQTLAKTFAQLPIGLAIFDRQRHLYLFNPALMDLTGLPPDFLSLRPSLLSVLDALRDRNMLPEPKDYRRWRRQLVEMEKAAASGQYEETWNLPDGQTFRVIGRPHPNGALALMIEDITNEVSRTRRYRSDLQLGQSVIDEMDEAVAVFSPSGQLVMTNRAYDALWSDSADLRFGDRAVPQCARHWRGQTAPGGLWQDVEEFISTVGNRVAWSEETRLLDGRRLTCRFVPLPEGATLVAFRAGEIPEGSKPAMAEATIALKTA